MDMAGRRGCEVSGGCLEGQQYGCEDIQYSSAPNVHQTERPLATYRLRLYW